MRIVGEVLITVKTTPMPSTKYGDTVCVAGLRLDRGAPEWVRLYPIAFRWLDAESQFKKYDVIDVEIRRRDADSRPESYSPTSDSFKVVDHLKDWSARRPILDQVPRTSTCALRRAAGGNHAAPSLGMVPVKRLVSVLWERHPGWTAAEEKKIAAALDISRSSLFGSPKVPAKLVAPRFKFSYRYECMDADCTGHRGQLLDWELTALERRLVTRGDDELKAAVEKRFKDMMFAEKRETSFFMGNFENPTKRQSFAVLGVAYPERPKPRHAALFELDGDELV
jgi:hypothetical protein